MKIPNDLKLLPSNMLKQVTGGKWPLKGHRKFCAHEAEYGYTLVNLFDRSEADLSLYTGWVAIKMKKIKPILVVFVFLMMLAFLIDQTQQLCCPLFNAVWKKWKSKRSLWEKVRSKFHEFHIKTMEDLYRSILDHKPIPLPV